MSQEGEKINLCVLKMAETLNLCGRTACVALAASVMLTGLLAQVISARWCVDALSSASLSQCVGT